MGFEPTPASTSDVSPARTDLGELNSSSIHWLKFYNFWKSSNVSDCVATNRSMMNEEIKRCFEKFWNVNTRLIRHTGMKFPRTPKIWLVRNKKSNLHYTRDITPKLVSSGGVHLRGLAAGQHSSEETSPQWRAVGDTVSNLTAPRIEHMAYRANSNALNHYAHLAVSCGQFHVTTVILLENLRSDSRFDYSTSKRRILRHIWL